MSHFLFVHCGCGTPSWFWETKTSNLISGISDVFVQRQYQTHTLSRIVLCICSLTLIPLIFFFVFLVSGLDGSADSGLIHWSHQPWPRPSRQPWYYWPGSSGFLLPVSDEQSCDKCQVSPPVFSTILLADNAGGKKCMTNTWSMREKRWQIVSYTETASKINTCMKAFMQVICFRVVN